MVEFLSDEWIDALADACGGTRLRSEPAGESLVVEPVVRGVPDRGEVRYRLVVDATTCSVGRAPADAAPADVSLEADYPTAVALARGELNAQAALAEGRLRVSGDVARLAGYAAALARFDDQFAAVRSTTSYPSG